MDRRAQMEARRRKILENAGSRLEKITGRPVEVPEFDFSRNESRSILNGAYDSDFLSTNHISFQDETLARNLESVPVGQMDVGMDQPQNSQSEVQQSSRLVDCLLFLTLGFLVRISYEYMPPDVPMPIYVPFGLVAIPKLLLYSKHEESFGAIPQMALQLGGISPRRINVIFSTLTFFRTLFQYFSLYITSFVLTHCISEKGVMHLIN